MATHTIPIGRGYGPPAEEIAGEIEYRLRSGAHLVFYHRENAERIHGSENVRRWDVSVHVDLTELPEPCRDDLDHEKPPKFGQN